MDINLLNHTKISSTTFLTSSIIWCLIMPFIHILSLFSNILCIIVFCSKTFIHKPIAIYFISLLISDSTTLLIGYTEMLDRESSMLDKSSLLCVMNGRVIHYIVDSIYVFLSKICLEWILYKVLWTRTSTILLAILSTQRCRTFFSIYYRETRFCATFACIISVLIAMLITCVEWTGIQCKKSQESIVYMEIFQTIRKKNSSNEFFQNYFSHFSSELLPKYSCLNQVFTSTISQLNCSSTESSIEFYSLIQLLLASHDIHVTESVANILLNTHEQISYLLPRELQQAKSADVIMKLFEKRKCQIALPYTICLKIYDFLHSISFGFNRHTLAIFFGNALPSFIVLLANLFSLKVIYFSNTFKSFKQKAIHMRRHRRLQNDIRAFLVILIESFSVITISWGIPIFLTMFHCQTLYVVSMAACPQIKNSLAIFLFTDLFNSSTNCLLYSLSGKLFRRKFTSILKNLFTCAGYCGLTNQKRDLNFVPSQQLELQPSNEPSINSHYGTNFRNSETYLAKQGKRITLRKTISDENGSLMVVKISGGNDTDIENDRCVRPKKIRKTIKITDIFN